MALPTTEHPHPPTQQAHTPGVGAAPGTVGPMRPMPRAEPLPPAEPTLADDIDPVLLARLYPEAIAGGLGDARAKAMEAGHAAHEAGEHLQAAQQAEQQPEEPPPARPPPPPAPPPAKPA